MKSMNCKNCGAGLASEGYKRSVVCPYCQTENYFTYESDNSNKTTPEITVKVVQDTGYSSSDHNEIDQIEKLHKLYEKGIISEEEFLNKKGELLAWASNLEKNRRFESNPTISNIQANLSLQQKPKWLTFILCLYLGIFGVHRFYTGHKKSGFLYLFTMGLFGFGWIFDLTMILLGKFKDKKGELLKGDKKIPVWVIVLSVLFIIMLIGSMLQNPSESNSLPDVNTEKSGQTSVAEPTEESPSVTKDSEPTEDPNILLPGTYIVGKDIQPGIYIGQTGNDLFDSCYWERMKDLSGELDAINANDNAIGRYYFEILDSDYAVKTGCPIKLFEFPTQDTIEIPMIIEPGVHLIGVNVKPGTYKGQAGDDIMDSCYWSRLKDVKFDLNSIIANDNSTGQFYVEIKDFDFALKTSCQLELVE